MKRLMLSSLGVVMVILLTLGVTKGLRSNSGGLDEEGAKRATDSLASALLSAVGNITANVTPETFEADSLAVSLLLPGCQDTYRLIDGTGNPLDPGNVPVDSFEKKALKEALKGKTTQEVENGFLRTVVPLTFSSENCAVCHLNYFEFELDEIIGAAAFKVPVE